MSLLLTLTLPEPPAGVFVIVRSVPSSSVSHNYSRSPQSGYLPLPHHLLSLAPPSLSLPHTRLAWLHGLADPYLTARGGEAGYDLLTKTVRFRDAKWRAVEGVEHGWNEVGAEWMFAWVKGTVMGE